MTKRVTWTRPSFIAYLKAAAANRAAAQSLDGRQRQAILDLADRLTIKANEIMSSEGQCKRP